MSLSCSTGIVGIEVRSIQTGIDDLGDMVTNGERNLTEGNEATQALIGLEQHEKAKLRQTAFGGTMSQEAFLGGWGVDLSQILRGQAPLEARIGGSFRYRHMSSALLQAAVSTRHSH